jgi:hypothetical protein
MLNLIITLVFTLCLFGCFSKNKTSPSYVIIAIDRLGSGSVSCPEYLEKSEGGFFTLCNDFIRMTNAYTTSLQSPAAIASLLTGQYPINHGLRHADNFLAFNHQTLAQVLLSKNYSTAFFSEGDPVKSYQGLNRGFQHFYDFSLAPENLGLSEVFSSAGSFLLKDEKPKLAFIYISSLKKINSDDGVVLDSVELELNNLFQSLKRNQKWHNTNVLVVGLQGQLAQSEKSPWPIVDLGEHNIKVEAFIKPATKPRDRDVSFQVDNNLSLADLGHTLFDWVDSKKYGEKNDTKENQILPELTTSKSMAADFTSLDNRPTKKLPMLIESSWPDWRYGYSPVYLILDDQYRVFVGKNLKIFNTLLNREISQFIDDQIPNERKYFYLTMAEKLNSEGKDQFSEADITRFSLGYQIWGQKNYKYPDILEDLADLEKVEENNKEISDWMAKLAVIHQDCKRLQKLAKKHNNKKWLVAANSCLNIGTRFSNDYRMECLRVFFKQIKVWSNQCQNDLLYHAWKLVRHGQSDSELKNFKNYLFQNQIKESKMQSNWKTFLSSALTYEIAIEPTDFELYYLQLSNAQKSLIDQAKLQ